MERLLTREELKKLTSTNGIIELLCGIPNFSDYKYENLSSAKRNLVNYTLNIELITEHQINGNLRRSMERGNLALLNRNVLTALSLLYFGVKDERGKYVKYICPYTGKEFELEAIRQELNKPYKERNLDEILELEHIIPHSSGGGTILFNCIPASRKANSVSEKGNLHLLDWLNNSKSSGYKYYENGGTEKLNKLVNYILSAYEISFEEYIESEINFYENQDIAQVDGVDNDTDLENERKKVSSKKKIREKDIEGYIPFLNQLVEQLEKEGYDTKEIRNRLLLLEEKGIINNLDKYTIVQKTIEKLFEQEDSKSYLTYSLNVDYIRLVNSIKANAPEEIKEIVTSRFEMIKKLIALNGKSIKDYFISLRDNQDLDLLYKNKANEREIQSFINNIKLGYDGKIDLFIDMLSEDIYTGYEKGNGDKNNIFVGKNIIIFKGYENIKGLYIGQLWSNNSLRIKNRIENQIEELINKDGKTQGEQAKLEKLQKAERAIDCYEFATKIDKRIDCYIEMLSEDGYTGYKKGVPNKNNIFGQKNEVPFKGYENIEGLTTSGFWSNNSDIIKTRLRRQIKELKSKENLTKEEQAKIEKLQKAERAIDCYEFVTKIDKRIDCYIEMLSEDEYTGYKKGVPNKNNIFGQKNEVPFKGYENIEGLTTSGFWSNNSDIIKTRLRRQIKELKSKENLTKEEQEKIEKLQKAKRAIHCYEFTLKSNLDKRIDCYIEMLSEDEYTGYKKGVPNKNNIFGQKNEVPFKGYENIEGLTTRDYWGNNSDIIKTRLRSQIKELKSKESLTKEEQEKIEKLKKAERAIYCYEFTLKSNLDKRIDCYIEMLSEDEYTGYEKGVPNKNNILGRNTIPFKGYENINGLSTRQFWSNNFDLIKTRLSNQIEELKGKEKLTKEEQAKLEKLQKAERAIDCYEFATKIDKRIECYIEMLSEDEYTGYKKGVPNKNNIFGQKNEVPFKGYENIEGLTTRQFWSNNSERIISRIFYNTDENGKKIEKDYSEPEYGKARKAILKYVKVKSIDEYIEKIKNEKKRNTLISLRENTCDLTMSEIENSGKAIRDILNEDRGIA